MIATRFAADRDFDVLCLGRFAVDFYAQQIGARLEDVTSFAKYLGGSSANTAFGCARLGLRAGLISRVGDDHLGRFLVETIAREGCDTSHVSVDPSRLTGAVVLGIKDRDTFPLIFLRENCADMAITEDDVEEAYIARSRALLITGTHFSKPHIDRISHLALERARRNDVRTVLDIDYRPVLWGLAGRGDGETRYVRSDTVTAHLQRILANFDLVIGTTEEFAIAGGSPDLMTALRAIRTEIFNCPVCRKFPMRGTRRQCRALGSGIVRRCECESYCRSFPSCRWARRRRASTRLGWCIGMRSSMRMLAVASAAAWPACRARHPQEVMWLRVPGYPAWCGARPVHGVRHHRSRSRTAGTTLGRYRTQPDLRRPRCRAASICGSITARCGQHRAP